MTIENFIIELGNKCKSINKSISDKTILVANLLEDNDSLKKNCKKIVNLRNEIKDLNEEFKYYSEMKNDAILLYKRLKFVENKMGNQKLSNEERETYSYMSTLIKEDMSVLEEKYGLKQEGKELENVKEPKKEYKNKNKVLKSIIGLVLAGTVIVGAHHVIKDIKNNKEEDASTTTLSDTVIEEENEVVVIDGVQNEIVVIDDVKSKDVAIDDKVDFTDVNNEQQVSDVADAFLENLNTLNPNNDYTKEEIIKMVQIINGGSIENATTEEVANLFFRLFDIMGQEALYASNMINGYEIEEDKRDGLINYTELTLNGTRGEELVEKIENARAGMINNPNKEDVSEYANEFMRLFVESWYLNGDRDEIPMSTLETPGMKVFSNMLMDSSANLADSVNPRLEYNRNIKVDGEEQTQTFYLDELYDEFNSAKCQDDGMFANDFSAYLDETIKTLKLK